MNVERHAAASVKSRLRTAISFSFLLWLPAILSDALHPFTLRHIAVAPPLQTLFVLTLVVGTCVMAITAVGALLISLPRPRQAQGDAQLAFMSSAAFVASALLIVPVMHSHPAVARLPVAVALGLVAVVACAVASLFTYTAYRAFAWMGVSNPSRARAFLSVVVWFATAVYRFSSGIADPRLVVLALALVAVSLWIASARDRGITMRTRAYAWGAATVAIAVTVLTPLAAVRSTRSAVSEAAVPPPAWNVLIVLIDTLRADAIGPGGAPTTATPFLTELAVRPRATYFARATAAAPSTVPSVKSLFTGQMPSAWGVSSTNEPPATNATTLPAAFANLGYTTSLVSANPLIDCGRFGAGTDWCWSAGGYRYFLRSFLLNDLWTARRVWEGFERVDRLHVHNIDGAIVLGLAQKRLDARRGPAPFFAYVHLIDPHWPYYTAAPGNPPPQDGEHSYVPFLRLNHGSPENSALRTGPAIAALRERYVRQVEHVDSLLRDFVAFLDQRDLRSNTIVILVGDHGEEFLEHNGFGHGHDVFQEQIHVPLLVLWPDATAFSNAPRRIDEPVSLADIVPTLEDLLDVRLAPAEPRAGVSLLPLLRDRMRDPRSPVVSEAFAPGRSFLSYREGSTKLRIRYDERLTPDSSPHVLAFDLAKDPHEAAPLRADDPSVRDLVARARIHLRATRSTP